jgi:hypothetical protein
MRGGGDLERAVQFRGVARGSEKREEREERVADGEQNEAPVTAVGAADVGCAQAGRDPSGSIR